MIHNVSWSSGTQVSKFSDTIRSLPWLLMSWLLASPGHQQPCYWPFRIGWSLFRRGQVLITSNISMLGNERKQTYLFYVSSNNKANLRDLIAATGQVISNWIQIVNFSARVTVKFDGWPRKTIGHFFYTTSSFVHHFKSIGEFKLDLQSRNTQFESKLVICYPVWPWNLMDDLGKQ